MKATELRVDRCRVLVLPVVKGPKSETRKVLEAFERVKPDRAAVSISKEELDGLRNIPRDFELELTRYEEIYVRNLSRFGDIGLPPPCYVAALEASNSLGIPLIPIDMPEREYTELYCTALSGFDLFRHSTRTWFLKKKRFRSRTPEEFVLEWDRRVNNLQGFRLVESKRAQAMASCIQREAREAECLLAVIELERTADVIGILRKLPNSSSQNH